MLPSCWKLSSWTVSTKVSPIQSKDLPIPLFKIITFVMLGAANFSISLAVVATIRQLRLQRFAAAVRTFQAADTNEPL